MPLPPAAPIPRRTAPCEAAPGPAIRLGMAVWIALCLTLFGCGPKQIAPLPENAAVIAGPQKDRVYLPPDDGQPLSPEEMDALISVGDFDRHIRGQDMIDVVLHFKHYLHQGRRTVEKNVERGELYLPHIRLVLKQKGLPGDLAYLPFIESGYDTRVRSRTGALGIWQFIPSTGRAYGMRRDWWIDERHCPYQSTEAAANYLSKLHERFKDWHLAITAYNAGQGRVARALAASGAQNFFELRRRNDLAQEKDRLTEENKQYLPRFLAVCKIMRNLEALGFAGLSSANARQVSEIRVQPATDLLSMSRRIGMKWDEFSAYNPAYLRYISPPGRSAPVFVPPHLSAAAAAFVRMPGKDDAGWTKYTVRQGDTFANIAGRTGVPAAELRRVNQVGELKAGKVLRIPRSFSAQAVKSTSAAEGKAAAKAQTGGEYTVQAGDTLYELARSWQTTTDSVMKANNLSGSKLSIGQKLIIPGTAPVQAQAAAVPAQPAPQPPDNAPPKEPPKSSGVVTYKVQPGDTVWGIARKFNLNPADLMRANNLTGKSKIRPGDALRVETP